MNKIPDAFQYKNGRHIKKLTATLILFFVCLSIFAGVGVNMEKSPGKRLIVCIGINKYSGEFAPLQFAVNDARDTCEVLQKLEKNVYKETRVVLLLDEAATKDAIFKAVSSADSDTSLIIFFAGHGFRHIPDGGGGSILPFAEKYSDDVWDYKIYGDKLGQKACNAGRITLLFDMNEAQDFFRTFAWHCDRSIQALGASQSDQEALEKSELKNGVFTSVLKEVLRKKKNPDDLLNLTEIYPQVRDRVSAITQGKQIPTLFYADSIGRRHR